VGADDMNMQYATSLTFFVALIRARQTLHVVASRETGGSKGPYGFVLDLPADCCEYVTYRKTGRSEEPLGNQGAFVKTFDKCSGRGVRQEEGAREEEVARLLER
jgi:hypothetical protein